MGSNVEFDDATQDNPLRDDSAFTSWGDRRPGEGAGKPASISGGSAGYQALEMYSQPRWIDESGRFDQTLGAHRNWPVCAQI